MEFPLGGYSSDHAVAGQPLCWLEYPENGCQTMSPAVVQIWLALRPAELTIAAGGIKQRVASAVFSN